MLWKLSLAVGGLAPATSALLVAPGSPCATQCGNVLSSNSGPDINCDANAYHVNQGVVFKNCIDCQLTSTYVYQNQTDLQWMLYNLRFAISYCLWGIPANPDVQSTPCTTSFACGPLYDAVEQNNLTTIGAAFDYCDNHWTADPVRRCQSCLRPVSNGTILANFFVLLDAACQQRPNASSVLSVEGDPFSTTQVNITTPRPTASPLPATTDYGPVSLGARVGIFFGGLTLLLCMAGFCIVMNGKRRRRTYLRTLEKRKADRAWPHGKDGGQDGQDMFESPQSQKPLRGWDDSPLSVHACEPADCAFPRYISPYSSQHDSPVSAADGGPSNANWSVLTPPPPHPPVASAATVGPRPISTTSTQEKMLMQTPLDHERRQQEIAIGLALGGDEASLRSKPSDWDRGRERETKGLGESGEAYELVESLYGRNASAPSCRLPAEPEAPVLHHPGYGRHYPPTRKTSGAGGGQMGPPREESEDGPAI